MTAPEQQPEKEGQRKARAVHRLTDMAGIEIVHVPKAKKQVIEPALLTEEDLEND